MRILYLIAFFSGLAVMGIELAASRLLAPYFGTSLFVWTSVIAVILAALSFGYYLGGRLSESRPHLRVLLGILFTSGTLLAAIPFIVRPLAAALLIDTTLISSASVVIVLGSFLLAMILFFIPIMLAGMTSPYLIKLATLERRDVGNVSGRIFAISTIGSIIGTFLPALVLIPWIGTKFTILIFSSILILIGVIGLVPRWRWLMVLALVLSFGALDAHLKPGASVVMETESAYQYLSVLQKNDARYLVYNEGGGVQSIFDPRSAFTGNTYFDAMSVLPTLARGRQVLILGLAGGTISRAMQSLYGTDPNFHVDGVELDPKVIAVGKQFFALTQPALAITRADARSALTMSHHQYDTIMVDAYANQMYIPFHLTTREFFATVQRHLTPHGIVAMNVNAADEHSALLRALENTLSSVFPHVVRAHVGEAWNYLLIASNDSIDSDRLRQASFSDDRFTALAESLPDTFKPVSFDEHERVLTDDRAPVEQLTDTMLWRYLMGRLRGERS